MYNSILETGNTPLNWHVIIFRMLPKNGDLTDVNNWRPIAVLPILYKIFSKLVYSRIHQILETNQSDDQFAFRKDRRIDDVFGILENIVGKTSEWNLLAIMDCKFGSTQSIRSNSPSTSISNTSTSKSAGKLCSIVGGII